METIKIVFQSNIKEKLIEFLNSFSKSELHIIEEDVDFSENKAFNEHRELLHLEVKKIESGESKLRSLEEIDYYLEKIISKYEN